MVWLRLSLAQLHSLITQPLIGQDVDKAFKQLNPPCINISNMHIVYVLILSLKWSACISCLLHFNSAVCVLVKMPIVRGNGSIQVDAVGKKKKKTAEVFLFFAEPMPNGVLYTLLS